MDDTPKIYLDEVPETQKRSKLAISIMVFVLLAIPVGVVLTLRSNDLRSSASNTPSQVRPLETQFKLITPQNSINNQTIFPLDIVINSDEQAANLFVSNLKFPADKLEVVAIASQSADLSDPTKQYVIQKWLNSSYDNQNGTIHLVGGIPTPGFQSQPQSQTTALMATVYFKSHSPGDAPITFDQGNTIMSTLEGKNILQNKNPQNLTLQIRDTIGDFSDNKYNQIVQNLTPPQQPTTSSLELISPKGGEIYSYNKPIEISWINKEEVASTSAKTTTKPKRGITQPQQSLTTVSLFMNNQFLGQLAEVPTDDRAYSWDPSQTLPIAYIKPENSFKIELQKKTTSGEASSAATPSQLEKILSDGPFEISLQTTITGRQLENSELTSEKTDLNSDGTTDYHDLSYLLSQFLAPVTTTNKKADLNNDLSINDLDLWYLYKIINY